MKYFVVLTILTLSGYAVNAKEPFPLTEEQKATALKYAGECMQQHKVPKGTFKELHSGNFENADQNLKCFVECFLEKYGFLIEGHEQSAVISDVLGSIVGAKKLSAIMSKCIGLKGSDNCDTAFELLKCFYNTAAFVL